VILSRFAPGLAAAMAGALVAAQPSPVAVTAARPQPDAVPAYGRAVSARVSHRMLGVNTMTWDGEMLAPSTVSALRALNVGVQRFPGGSTADLYDWQDNRAYDPATGTWSAEPVSLAAWASILRQSGETGLFTLSYGINRTATGTNTPANAAALARTIVRQHLPITAIEIGNEVYGAWEPDRAGPPSPYRYARTALAMARAIHAVDPALAVGVDLDLPAAAATAAAAAWNRPVLALDAPSIQFVSVHAYQETAPVSPAVLFADVASIGPEMAALRTEMARDGGTAAARLPVWVTELNSYLASDVPPYTVDAVNAQFLAESTLSWLTAGAAQVDWWALHGSAHAAAGAAAQIGAYGTYALASDGSAPEPEPANALYPDGRVLADLAGMMGDGATLTTWPAAAARGLFVARIRGSHGDGWVVANNLGTAQTAAVGGRRLRLAAFTVRVLMPRPQGGLLDPAFTYRPAAPVAVVRHVSVRIWDGRQTFVITGSGFGNAMPPVTPAVSAGQDSPYLILTALTPAGVVNYGSPGNWDGLDYASWTNRRIVVALPEGSRIPAGEAIRVYVTDDAGPEGIVSAQAPAPPLSYALTVGATGPASRPVVRPPSLALADGLTAGMLRATPAATPASHHPTAGRGTPRLQGAKADRSRRRPNRHATVAPPVARIRTATIRPRGKIQVITITGSGFGRHLPPLTAAHNGGHDSGYLLVQEWMPHGLVVRYGWTGNWYGLHYVRWSDHRIVVETTSRQPLVPGHPIRVYVADSAGPPLRGPTGGPGVRRLYLRPAGRRHAA
jgi:hypothetical protein